MSEFLDTIRWDQLEVVGLRTTAEGPFAEDVFWVLVYRGGRRVDVPSLLVGDDVIDVMVKHLPGLDCAKVVDAMACSQERVFRLWHRTQSPRALDREQLALRFVALVGDVGGRSGDVVEVVETLLDAWSDRARRYHTLEHLSDCLRELDDSGEDDPETRRRVELALWYHDVIYDPVARDNEPRSAQRLLADARALGLPTDLAVAAARCVRATAHLRRPGDAALTPDEALVVDVDLAILGQEPLRFMEFEHAVREEYASIPAAVYFWKRRAFFRALLAAERIFHTDAARLRLEAQARENLAGLLGSDRYRWACWL